VQDGVVDRRQASTLGQPRGDRRWRDRQEQPQKGCGANRRGPPYDGPVDDRRWSVRIRAFRVGAMGALGVV
jgi:hypothetical protein